MEEIFPNKMGFLDLQSEILVEKFVQPRRDKTIFSYNRKYYALAQMKSHPVLQRRDDIPGVLGNNQISIFRGEGVCVSK